MERLRREAVANKPQPKEAVVKPVPYQPKPQNRSAISENKQVPSKITKAQSSGSARGGNTTSSGNAAGKNDRRKYA